MLRFFKSPLVVSGLLTTLMFSAAWANVGEKFASSNDSVQLAIKSSGELIPAQLKTQPSSSSTIAARLNSVKVFFPKQPRSNNDFSYVEAVNRTTQSQSVARFAVEQLIAGPTSAERQKGFVGAVQLRDSSNCGGDFNVSISRGAARLQFCRTVVSAGVGDDARAKSAVTATLKQFRGVQSVVILDKNGNCFGDMSGENRCLSNSRS